MTVKMSGMSADKGIEEGHIASDDCSFCGAECGHNYKGCQIFLGGVKGGMGYGECWGIETEEGALIIANTCGDLSWICVPCWAKIKPVLQAGKEPAWSSYD